MGNSYACSCFIRSVRFGLCVVNQKVFGMKVFIFPVHSIAMGFGCDHCHALTEFSDLLSLTFCCVALMCWFLQKSDIWFGTNGSRSSVTHLLFIWCLFLELHYGLIMLSSCPAVFDEALLLHHCQNLTAVIHLIGWLVWSITTKKKFKMTCKQAILQMSVYDLSSI